LERLYNTANDSDFAKEVQVMAGQKLADLFWFNAPALLAAAKLSEARARACELAKALIANTQGMSEGECGFWEHIEPLKTALAAAEKGSA